MRITACFMLMLSVAVLGSPYAWNSSYSSSAALCRLISVPHPDDWERIETEPGSWAHWIRNLPLKPAGTPVMLYNGKEKSLQNLHVAVIDMDIPTDAHQTPAPLALRLWSEFTYMKGKYWAMRYKLNRGDFVDFREWAEGARPYIRFNKLLWLPRKPENYSYQSFRQFLSFVCGFTDTSSLDAHLYSIEKYENIRIGDLFLDRSSHGHVLFVMDMARHLVTGEKIMLLAHGGSPAQDMQLLKNPSDPYLSPWFRVDCKELVTPQWIFYHHQLRRFIKTF